MKKNLLVNILLFALMISACGAQPPAEVAAPTLTETLAPTVTEAPTATETLSVEAPSPTFIPTNIANCTNSAAFVSDVTIADNEIVAAGASFTKIWRIKNTGTCIWGPDYVLTHYSGDRMLAPFSVPLSVTFPEQTVDVAMKLIAPKPSGVYKGYFVIKNPAGLIMKVDNDSRLWVVINVEAGVAEVSTPTQSSGSIPVTGGEAGFANVTCSFSADASKVTAVINAVNAYRVQNGLPAYTVNDLLTKAAVAHANDMACNKLFGHTGSNDSTPALRVAASGYSASSITENVYGSYPPLTGQGAVDWWRNDKTDLRHNQNLLSVIYTEIGVGYSFFDNYGYYVLVFAKPQ